MRPFLSAIRTSVFRKHQERLLPGSRARGTRGLGPRASFSVIILQPSALITWGVIPEAIFGSFMLNVVLQQDVSDRGRGQPLTGPEADCHGVSAAGRV